MEQNLPTTEDISYVPPEVNQSSSQKYRIFIILGYRGFQVYDPMQNKALLVNNPNVIDCSYSSALIKNNLYVLCQGNDELGDSKVLKRGVYAIDLNTKKIIKSYHDHYKGSFSKLADNSQTWISNPTLINGEMTSRGSELLIGAWSGVHMIDTTNDSTVFYNAQELGFDDQCYGFDINLNEKAMWTMSMNSEGCISSGISIYTYKDHEWKFFDSQYFKQDLCSNVDDIGLVNIGYSKDKIIMTCYSGIVDNNSRSAVLEYHISSGLWKKIIDGVESNLNVIKYLHLENSVSVFADELPTSYFDEKWNLITVKSNPPNYFGYSNKINGKYYLVSDSGGIYTVSSSSLPMLLFKTPLNIIGINPYSWFYVNRAETTFLILGLIAGDEGEGEPIPNSLRLGQAFSATKIDLKSGEVVDLLKEST